MEKINKIKICFPAILLLVAEIFFLNGCSSSYTKFRTPTESNAPSLLYSLPPGKFGKLWVQRTVKLNILNPETSSYPLFGGGENEGSRRMGRSIPMDINVTYLDSTLIEEGLEEFGSLAEMNQQEKTEYENQYKNKFMPKDFRLFWMEMNSSYSEEALASDKWTFYLEDEKGNTYEPSKIIELPSQAFPGQYKDLDLQPSRLSEEHRGGNFRFSKKTFLLGFGKNGYNGYDIIRNAKTLKMVYFEWSTRDLKRVGTLDLSGINANKLKLQ